jgi:hypothetical protein
MVRVFQELTPLFLATTHQTLHAVVLCLGELDDCSAQEYPYLIVCA